MALHRKARVLGGIQDSEGAELQLPRSLGLQAYVSNPLLIDDRLDALAVGMRDDRAHLLWTFEQPFEILDEFELLVVLILDFLAFQGGQPAQLHIEDCLRLDLVDVEDVLDEAEGEVEDGLVAVQFDEERGELEQILGSKQRMKTLVKKELQADAETYGDVRRSKLVTREAAQALKEEDILPSEPVTVVLSQSGWVRLAKGHDIDPTSLNYRAGDAFLDAARGRSNEQAVFLDSSGRAYALPAHSLPSARGLGEPLTSRFTLPSGARVVAALAGPPERKIVLASTFGYGFVTELGNLHSRMKAGKAMISLPKGAQPVLPCRVDQPEGATAKSMTLVCATSEGHLLAFSLAELPELAKGKGNKILSVGKGGGGLAAICVVATAPRDPSTTASRPISTKPAWNGILQKQPFYQLPISSKIWIPLYLPALPKK